MFKFKLMKINAWFIMKVLRVRVTVDMFNSNITIIIGQ